jgi:hypothetical protein
MPSPGGTIWGWLEAGSAGNDSWDGAVRLRPCRLGGRGHSVGRRAHPIHMPAQVRSHNTVDVFESSHSHMHLSSSVKDSLPSCPAKVFIKVVLCKSLPPKPRGQRLTSMNSPCMEGSSQFMPSCPNRLGSSEEVAIHPNRLNTALSRNAETFAYFLPHSLWAEDLCRPLRFFGAQPLFP